jgi:hypothetical protein
VPYAQSLPASCGEAPAEAHSAGGCVSKRRAAPSFETLCFGPLLRTKPIEACSMDHLSRARTHKHADERIARVRFGPVSRHSQWRAALSLCARS